MHEILAQAFEAAKRSHDPSTKVGAVVVDQRGCRWFGWNQFPRGIPSTWWTDRELKYRAVVHAEMAALLQYGLYTDGATMYVTHHPCCECAKFIAFAGISKVVCPSGPWRDDPAIDRMCRQAKLILDLAGVEVVHHTNGVLD